MLKCTTGYVWKIKKGKAESRQRMRKGKRKGGAEILLVAQIRTKRQREREMCRWKQDVIEAVGRQKILH